MDDVKAMTRAGETVGKAVSSGWLTARRSAKRAGKAGADAASRAAHAADAKLTARGVSPRQLTEALAEGAEVARQEVVKGSRRARRKLARTAKHTRKELAKAAKEAKKDAKHSKPVKRATKSMKQHKRDVKDLKATLKSEAIALRQRAKEEAAALQAEAPKRKRRWPKMLLLVVVASGVAYVVRSKAAATEPTPLPEPRRDEAAKPDAETDTGSSKSADGEAATQNGQRKQSAKK